jgi:hypothetical protein
VGAPATSVPKATPTSTRRQKAGRLHNPASILLFKVRRKVGRIYCMATLLDRYRDGDCEAVWSDLERLGDAVHQEQYLADARAVAEETMKRVRHNAELVASRLAELGYEFATQKAVTDQFELIRASFDHLDRLQTDFPDFHPLIHDHMKRPVDELRQRRPELLEKLGALEEHARQERYKWTATERVVVPPAPSVADDIAQYEAFAGGSIPLSLKAWCEIVGSVHFEGTHPILSFRRPQGTLFNGALPSFDAAGLRAAGAVTNADLLEAPETLPLADPLDIDPDLTLEDDTPGTSLEYLDGAKSNPVTARRIFLGIDDRLKAGFYKSGEPYYIDVPNPATADAPFHDWHHHNFVSFLRIAFAWGGLPGWERYSERPERELAYLKEGLLIF